MKKCKVPPMKKKTRMRATMIRVVMVGQIRKRRKIKMAQEILTIRTFTKKRE